MTIPVAALLLGPASVMALMSRNLNQTSFADVLPALLGTVTFALVAWLVAGAARRRWDGRTALVAAVWVAGAVFYTGLFGSLNAWLDGGYPMVRSLPIALAALALATVLILRLPAALAGALHLVASVVGLVLLASPLWSAGAYEWRNGVARAVYDPDNAAAMIEGAAAATEGAQHPDIYHFVFDRYGSAETLAGQYGVQEWIGEFLEARGFYVATDSYSNYLKTGHSLASMFHMDYLDVLADDPRIAPDNWHPIFEILDDHRAARFLKAQGYRIVQFGSWWVGTYDSAIADENHPHGFSEFNMLYLRRTMLRPIFHALPDTPLTMRLDWDNAQCQRVARQIDRIKAIGDGDRPVYVFAHILVPHGPYIFAPDGKCLTPSQAIARGSQAGYADQVAYANEIIREVVSTLLAEDRTPPIILIHADEGPFPERDSRIPWQNAPAEALRIKTSILQAFYFPGQDYRQLSPQITPVNTFRVLFNAEFGTRFPILPDRTFAFPNDATLYDFYDVTERVRGVAQSE